MCSCTARLFSDVMNKQKPGIYFMLKVFTIDPYLDPMHATTLDNGPLGSDLLLELGLFQDARHQTGHFLVDTLLVKS